MDETSLISEQISEKSKILLSLILHTHAIAAHGGLFGSTSLAVRGLSVVSLSFGSKGYQTFNPWSLRERLLCYLIS